MKKAYLLSLMSFLIFVLGLITLIKRDANVRRLFLSSAKVIKNEIYREAVLYNPKGDFIPDQWDDTIFKEIEKQI